MGLLISRVIMTRPVTVKANATNVHTPVLVVVTRVIEMTVAFLNIYHHSIFY